MQHNLTQAPGGTERQNPDTHIIIPVSVDDRSLYLEALGIEGELLADDISGGTSLLGTLGTSIERQDDSLEVRVPTAEALNRALRAVGMDDRDFTEFRGGLVQPETYLDQISKGVLPLASDPDYRLHDMANHVEGFILLPPRALGILKHYAQKALEIGSPSAKDHAISEIETWTAVTVSSNNLTQLYEKHMSKFSASIMAKKDMREVDRARRALRSVEKDIVSGSGDEDLPIK